MAVNLLTFEITDAEGHTKTITVHLPEGAAIADVQGLAEAATAALDNIIGGKVTEVTYSKVIDISAVSGMKPNPLAETRVAAGGTLSFQNENGVAYSQYIPSLRDSQITGKTVSTETAEMQVWQGIMVDGVNTADPCDLSGLDLVSLTGGKKSTRK